MILASTVSILVSVMVWRACHRSAVGEVAINWHDLFRATHTGEHTGTGYSIVASAYTEICYTCVVL
jgi:hypothetical protein